MTPETRCRTCCWYDQDTSTCRRQPPVVVFYPPQQDCCTRWPFVAPDIDWCRYYEPEDLFDGIEASDFPPVYNPAYSPSRYLEALDRFDKSGLSVAEVKPSAIAPEKTVKQVYGALNSYAHDMYGGAIAVSKRGDRIFLRRREQ